MLRIINFSLVALMLLPARAQSVLEPAAQRGFVIARTHCARCHSIDRVTPSPLAISPPFRILHESYPVEQFEEALAEGIPPDIPTTPCSPFRFPRLIRSPISSPSLSRWNAEAEIPAQAHRDFDCPTHHDGERFSSPDRSP